MRQAADVDDVERRVRDYEQGQLFDYYNDNLDLISIILLVVFCCNYVTVHSDLQNSQLIFSLTDGG